MEPNTQKPPADTQGPQGDLLLDNKTEGAKVTSVEMDMEVAEPPSSMERPTQDDVVEGMTEDIGDLRLKQKRLSGAAKRRKRRERDEKSGAIPQCTPDTQVAGKRGRSEDKTPPSIDKKVKRPRVPGPKGGTRHYADAASGLPRLAILHKSRGREVTEEEGSLIEDGIVELMDSLGEADFIPRFQETHVYRGTLRVTCADTQSERWLKENIHLVRKWEGASLEVLGVNELPKIIKMIAYFPGKEKDPKILLTRLQKQNPGLQTGRWQVYATPNEHEDASTKSVKLVLGVEESCLPVLEKVEMRPYCGMRRATFQVARRGAQRSAAEPSEDTGPKKA